MGSERGTPDVVIVGGGIGGLANAVALARAGCGVRVLEREAEFGEVGAGLQMAPNATRILRRWGLLDAVVGHGVLPARMVMRDALDGTELTHLDLHDVGRRYGAPYVVVHRTDLHAVLLEAAREAGVDLVTGVQVADVEQHADAATAVSLSGAGGANLGAVRRDTGRVVLAADGLTSGLRRLLSDDEPVSSGYAAYRGAVPMDAARAADPAADQVTLYVGPGLHLVQYALRGGAVLNQVAVFASGRAAAGEAEWGTPAELDAAFAPTCAPVRAALPFLGRDRCWRMYDRDPIPGWVGGRLALTGDAAHPMLQYLAQGACQAIEDAECLASLAGPGPDRDWDAALAGYAVRRTARTAVVQRRARNWGELWHADGLFRAVRNEMMRLRDPADQRHVTWLYGALT